MSTFKKMTVLNFFNIAVIALLINFALEVAFFNKIKVFTGDYEDFNEQWYKQIGATIGMTLW